MAKRSMFVGMDVHKESIDVSLAEEGRDGEVRRYGVIPGDLEAVAKVVRALRAPHRRFDHPRQLMAFLGLVPSEYLSGPSIRRGGITKAGNPHARQVLAEATWAYQGVPRIGRQMLYRQEALPKTICDIAWKAQLRLTSRFRKLVARGEAKPKVATAIARELTGFIWAIARECPRRPRNDAAIRSVKPAASRPGGEPSGNVTSARFRSGTDSVATDLKHGLIQTEILPKRLK